MENEKPFRRVALIVTPILSQGTPFFAVNLVPLRDPLAGNDSPERGDLAVSGDVYFVDSWSSLCLEIEHLAPHAMAEMNELGVKAILASGNSFVFQVDALGSFATPSQFLSAAKDLTAFDK